MQGFFSPERREKRKP